MQNIANERFHIVFVFRGFCRINISWERKTNLQKKGYSRKFQNVHANVGTGEGVLGGPAPQGCDAGVYSNTIFHLSCCTIFGSSLEKLSACQVNPKKH